MRATLLLALLQQNGQPWWLGPLALLFLVSFAAAGYLLWYRRRRPDRTQETDDEDAPLPPLIFPPRSALREPDSSDAPASDRLSTTRPSAEDEPAMPEEAEPRTDDVASTDEVETDPGKPGITDSIRIAPTPIRFSLQSAGAPPDPVAPTSEEAPTVPESAGNVHFHRPADGTLQLLPGRLQVLGDTAHEIRFVRPAGGEPVITFGRTPGEPLTHIQLDAPTVSRIHARMHFRDGAWRIVNLSHTNPVVVNGTRLNGAAAPAGRLLEDGDLVEMGEVSFRFRMP